MAVFLQKERVRDEGNLYEEKKKW